MRRMIGLMVTALVLAGCRSSSDIEGGRYYRSFVFTRHSSGTEGVQPDPGFRAILVTGTFEAPDGCQDLKPRVEDDNRDLLVTITAQPHSGTCTQTGLGYYNYTLVLGSFFPGSYHLEILHKDSRGTRTIFDANVVVQQ